MYIYCWLGNLMYVIYKSNSIKKIIKTNILVKSYLPNSFVSGGGWLWHQCDECIGYSETYAEE